MKDLYGNEYVRPAACSHLGCPPWQCLMPELPPPPPSPTREELEQDERDRRDRYRKLADGLRPAADTAPTPEIRARLERVVSDMDLMAEGRVAETVGWKAVQVRERAVEDWQIKVRRARSERLIVGAIVGGLCGLGFLYCTWGEFGGEIPKALISTFLIASFCTWSFKSLLNLILGLPKIPQPASHGGSGRR